MSSQSVVCVHVSLSEYHALGDAIIALNTPAFTSRYVALLREIVDFDCAVMLGYRHNKHPIYLYDSIPDNRELLFQRYLTESYQHDPFYRLVADTQQEGVFHLSEMTDAPHSYQQHHYQQQFYPQTGWQDEMSLVVQLDHERWILLYLGHLAAGRSFSAQDRQALKQRFHTLAPLCRQHWSANALLLAHSDDTTLESETNHTPDMRRWVERALTSFGTQLLSPREQQITALLVQGLDSQEIATQLGITHGTVKNHRKRIYAQLHVASLSELFQLFLNHLIGAPNHSPRA